MSGAILIVDDEYNARRVLRAILEDDGFQVMDARSVEDAVELFSDNNEFDAVVTDLMMPGQTGLDLLREIHGGHPDLPVVILTAYGTVGSAVSAMRDGAFYYMIKPPDYDCLKGLLHDAIERRKVVRQENVLYTDAAPLAPYSELIGRSQKIRELFTLMDRVKHSETNLLILGESGTGKEVVARAIHTCGKRREGPFIALNCAALPSSLLENEIFGHERGAYTHAVTRQMGKVEMAHKGTLFLDEIGDMDLSVQVKFLRVLEERTVERIGGGKQIPVDFRLICATHCDLKELVRQGKFRQDLYYRIHVITLKIPPLRERQEDIPLLVQHFLDKYSQRERSNIRSVAPEAMELFLNYPWPGNVRELAHFIEQCVVLSHGSTLNLSDLPSEMKEIDQVSTHQKPHRLLSLAQMEKDHVLNALRTAKGNKSEAAKLLGISRKTLYSHLKLLETS